MRVAVLPVDGAGTLPPTNAARIRESIAIGLRRADLEVIDSNVVDGLLEGQDCQGTGCATAVAHHLSADWVVHAQVTAADSVYDARLEAIGAKGGTLATATEGCKICGLEELTQLVAGRTAALATKVGALDLGPPRVEVRSEPSGAEVWIDDELVGHTPLEHVVDPGEHVVRLAYDGYSAQRRRVMAVEGTTDTLRFELLPSPAAQQKAARRLQPWAIASLGAGTVALGAGVTLLAIDERPFRNPCDPDPQGRCAQRYDTLGGGIALTVAGGVLLATGVALLVLDRRRQPSDTHADHRVRLSRGGLGLAF